MNKGTLWLIYSVKIIADDYPTGSMSMVWVALLFIVNRILTFADNAIFMNLNCVFGFLHSASRIHNEGA
jgi:hypothetical protein